MNATFAQAPELEIDALRYLFAVLDQWKLIILVAVVFAAAAYGYSQTLPNIYEGFVRVAIVDPEDPGGIKPDERRASEVLTLVEHGFVMGTSRDNYHEVIRAKMRSRLFTTEFMRSHGVYQILYPEHWNERTQSWNEDFVLNKAEAIKWFAERIRFIEHNPETDIITIRMRWTDPVLAKQWSNQFVAAFNNHIRERILIEVERKQIYLQRELENIEVVDMQKSIYRLIEAQTAIAMLANSREQYALEVIDPAIMPFDRFSPAPKRLTIFAFVAGAMLMISLLISRLLLRSISNTLNEFKQNQSLSSEAI